MVISNHLAGFCTRGALKRAEVTYFYLEIEDPTTFPHFLRHLAGERIPHALLEGKVWVMLAMMRVIFLFTKFATVVGLCFAMNSCCANARSNCVLPT